MSEEILVVKELSPYESITADIVYDEVQRDGLSWNVARGENEHLHRASDLELATVLTRQPSLLSTYDGAKILVLNCGAGFAGMAALRLHDTETVFVGSSDETILNMWKSIFLNASDCMASVHCFSTIGVHWADLNETASSLIW
jgi:hypothetical protein